MDPKVSTALADVPLRNAKSGLRRGETEVQQLNPVACAVVDKARRLARLEAKQMATTMGVSHSYVLRGLKSEDDLGFYKLWALSDDFWFELACLILETRGLAKVRRLFEVEKVG